MEINKKESDWISANLAIKSFVRTMNFLAPIPFKCYSKELKDKMKKLFLGMKGKS